MAEGYNIWKVTGLKNSDNPGLVNIINEIKEVVGGDITYWLQLPTSCKFVDEK